jgi:hypothetical protein
MRVSALTVGLLLTAAVMSTSGPAAAGQHKVTCLCDCPDDYKTRPHHAMTRPPVHRPMRHLARASGGYYDYAAAGAIGGGAWHGPWRVAPNDMIQAYGAPPQSYPVADYGPPQGYGSGYDEPVHIDDRGWSGGVGANGDGGGGGGFEDGYGQVHFANGGSQENGPSYNSYNQSFQYNPSSAGPFQNRLMGGLAPASSGSK